MQIINTSIEKFIVLNSIKSIENKHGYAIRFSGNKKLKRFATSANMRLEGTPKAVHFNNDMFLRTVIKEQGKALGDFAMLEIAANNSDWYDVEHHSSYDTFSIWLGFACGLLIIGNGVISIRLRPTHPTKESCDKKKAADAPKLPKRVQQSKTSKTPKTKKGNKSK